MNLIVPVSYFFGSPCSEIWQLDTSTGNKKLLLTLPVSEREVRGKGITGLTWLDDNSLVACDFNRLLKLDKKRLKVLTVYEDQELNDLHSLNTDQDFVYVANTGRDSIDVYNHKLELQERIDCLSRDEWQNRATGNYSTSGSYFDSSDCGIPFHRRRVPDKWHFNHVFKVPNHLGGQLIATSFATRSLLDVNSLQPVSSTFPAKPHDGVAYEGGLWVTTVSGQIYRAPFKIPFQFVLVFDLFEIATHQGWCRGLLIAEGSMFIGITSIYEATTRTDWLSCPIEDTRSGIYQLNIDTMEIEAFHDFSSTNGTRIFTMIKDR